MVDTTSATSSQPAGAIASAGIVLEQGQQAERPNAPTILLLGGTGAVGQSIAATLSARHIPYRVVGRSLSSLKKKYGDDPLAEIATWDPNDKASIAKAVQGMKTVIHLCSSNYWEFHLHPVMMRSALDCAIEAGVEKYFLISDVYCYGNPSDHDTGKRAAEEVEIVTPVSTSTRCRIQRVTEQYPREPKTVKGKMRREQETILLNAHSNGQIKALILRLPDFYGPGIEKSFLQPVFDAIRSKSSAYLIGPIDTPHEFVFVPDVGPIAVDLLHEESAFGRWWNLGGAGVTSQYELMTKAFAAVNREPTYRVLKGSMLWIAGWFDKFLGEVWEMRYLHTNPVIMDDSELRKLLPNIKKTPYDEGIKRCLEHQLAAEQK